MSTSFANEEFELNYVKIDTKNELRLLGVEDFGIETNTYMSTLAQFQHEEITKKLNKFLTNESIPESSDLLKVNIEYHKKILKFINNDKKKVLYNSVNTILSIDYKDKFIFNKSNVQDICIALAHGFSEIKKKYNFNTYKDFRDALGRVKLEKFDCYKLFINNDYLKMKEKEKERNDFSLSRCSQNKPITASTPMKDIYDENSEEENNPGNEEVDKSNNKAKGIFYIDNNLKNIILSSDMKSDSNTKEDELRKLYTKEYFLYPSHNKKYMPEKLELPIEIYILLYKLKNIKTLIFQIKNVDEQFEKMAIFLLINLSWLFIKGIDDVKFDLENEEMLQELNNHFNERSIQEYYFFNRSKDLVYYTICHQARTINCWDPEGDIYFDDNVQESKNENNKIVYSYNPQPNEEASSFDNHLFNIYDEFGNVSKMKYIIPINNAFRPDNIDYINYNDSYDPNSNNIEPYTMSKFDAQKGDMGSLNLPQAMTFTKTTISNINDIPSLDSKSGENISPILNKYKSNLHMIPIYSYFFSTNLKKIKRLSLYFQTPFTYEINNLFKANLNSDNSHFLILAKKIESLNEANFSFNCLDNTSFDYILGIINNNTNITCLRLSFFTPDINYYDDSLFNLCAARKIKLPKLFQEYKKYLLTTHNKKRKMNYFILNEKFLDGFSTNLCNFFNLLKMQAFNGLNELVLRFDMPFPILESEKYVILIIKFIINIFVMLTFQENRIKTFKILAPNLILNCNKMPYIKQLFEEISLKNETEVVVVEQETIKKGRKMSQKENLGDAGREILEKLSQQNFDRNDNDYKIDVDKNIEKYGMKKGNSVLKKNYKGNEILNNMIKNKKDATPKSKRNELNRNTYLENIILQAKIFDLPQIFNICIMNNLSGLKSINLGKMDKTTFVGFINSYKKNYTYLTNLISLKISLDLSVISYANSEKYVLDYINLNSPKIEEKFLFSDLQIKKEVTMKEFIELVYLKAKVTKLVVQISNENEHILSKVMSKFISEKQKECKTEMYSLIFMMNTPQLNKLYNLNILECLSSYYEKKKTRAIICKEENYSYRNY